MIFIKKVILIILAIIVMYMIYGNVKAQEIIIPDTAIRLRVIPNSNSSYDQVMKEKVKKYLEEEVYLLLNDVNNIDDARNVVESNLDNINNEVENIFVKENYNQKFDVNFGYNYFPEKEYKGIKYEKGYYESLVITIGKGEGDNFWCVLFPSFCLIDSKDLTDSEYQSYIYETIKKLF